MSSSSSSSSPPSSALERKRCQICREEIVKFKGLHYGAMTCYSCRAFFRRCHSADRKEPFKATCKNQVRSTNQANLRRSIEVLFRLLTQRSD